MKGEYELSNLSSFHSIEWLVSFCFQLGNFELAAMIGNPLLFKILDPRLNTRVLVGLDLCWADLTGLLILFDCVDNIILIETSKKTVPRIPALSAFLGVNNRWLFRRLAEPTHLSEREEDGN